MSRILKESFRKALWVILLCALQASSSIYSSQFLNLDSIAKETDTNHFFGVFRFESMDYIRKLPESENLNRQQYFSTRLGVITHQAQKLYGFGMDLQAGKFNFGTSNYSVQEIYGYYQLDNDFKFYGGRKKFDWSTLDSYWKTSFWQPNYAIDYLRPEEQGLFGAFFEYHKPEFHFVTFTTPVFIPNMGVDVREESGALVSDSRWFRQPSDKYDFNGRIKSLTYTLNVPEIRNLVSKPGAGLNVGVGSEESGFWINQSVGYKPVNDLILKRQGFAEASEKVVNVSVSPDVTYHSIYSVDMGFVGKGRRFLISYLEDSPKDKNPEEGWVIQRLNPVKVYSLMAEKDFESEIIKNLKTQLGYIKVYGGDIYDVDSAGNKDSFTLFDERLKFYNAVLFKFQGHIFSLFRKSILTKVSYLRDFDQMGSLLNTELQYFPVKNWAVLIGGDFISVDVENNSSKFLNQYRANDRVYGGVNYVF
ncbi:MAG: transposase [Bdellovibrionaceae bacterium]|nr:transposase [Pseudobdellovibrionaceae bacterium]NUM58300.1 transposase [Pseudobdellovibrionaceae bacterium]